MGNMCACRTWNGHSVEEEESQVAKLLEKEAKEREEQEAKEQKAREEETKAKAAAQQQAEEEKRLLAVASALGWQRVPVAATTTSQRQHYWFHAGKNQTAWDTPLEVLNRLQATAVSTAPETTKRNGPTSTPSGWLATTDNQGRTYYYHPSTGETSWVPR